MKRTKYYIRIIGITFDPLRRKILLGKNYGDKFLSFLDGEIENDEELNSSLKRITKEKTGYIVSNLGAVFAELKDKKGDELRIYFLCEIKEGKEKPGKKVKELRWVKSKEIEELINEKLPKRLKEYLSNIAG